MIVLVDKIRVCAAVKAPLLNEFLRSDIQSRCESTIVCSSRNVVSHTRGVQVHGGVGQVGQVCVLSHWSVVVASLWNAVRLISSLGAI